MTLPHGFIFVFISLDLSHQKVLAEVRDPKRDKKAEGGFTETELSTEESSNFLDTATMFCVHHTN